METLKKVDEKNQKENVVENGKPLKMYKIHVVQSPNKSFLILVHLFTWPLNL